MTEPAEEPAGVLAWLQDWYAANCDGEWEHIHGVSIDTLDNPGWCVTISLEGTPLLGRPLPKLTIDRSEHDWLRTWTQDRSFRAACGPLNLGEALEAFRRWATTAG